jgi:hypothetical protein
VFHLVFWSLTCFQCPLPCEHFSGICAHLWKYSLNHSVRTVYPYKVNLVSLYLEDLCGIPLLDPLDTFLAFSNFQD